MTDTETIHDLFRGADDFVYLVKQIDSEQSMHELISSVEAVGRELKDDLDFGEVAEIDDISIGWLRIAWEGHHTAARIEGRAFADMMDEA